MANIRSDTLQMSFTEPIKRRGPCIESLLFISHALNLFSNINTCYTCTDAGDNDVTHNHDTKDITNKNKIVRVLLTSIVVFCFSKMTDG